MPGKVFLKSLLKRAITIVFTWNVVLVCIVATFILIGAIGAAATMNGESSSDSSYVYIYGRGDKELLSIPIRGLITGTETKAESLFSSLSEGQTAGYSIKDQLYAAADDSLIQGVVLEIDSPGGTIYGAHAIADGVAYYKTKTKKPVYAHISGTGASGAYWAASSADKVFVDYGSDVGSIGVILGPFEYYNKILAQDGGLLGGGVMTENGIETVTLTAGKSKDVGSPYRRLTPEETAMLQKTVNNEYDGFVQFVSEHRDIPAQTIRDKIGAMVYDPKTALELKLVDGIANRQDAYDKLAEAINAKDNYHVVQEQRNASLVESLLGAVTRIPQPSVQKFDSCKLTRSTLAYHGDVTSLCSQ